MAEFKKSNFGGRKNYGKRPDSFSDKMYSTTCAQCGKQCEVPFRPNGSRPVYCRACFASQGGAQSGEMSRSDSFKREMNREPQAGNGALNDIKTALSMINIKLDKVLSAIEESAAAAQKEADSE